MSRRGWLLFGAMCVIWGIPYLLIRVAVREVSPVFLVFARTAIAALLLLPLAARRNELRGLLPHWRPIVAFAVIELAIPWPLLASAEQHLTSSLTALLVATVPLIGALIATFTGDDDRLGGRRLAGLLLGLVGVAAIAGVSVRTASVPALLAVGGVAVSYAIGPIVLSRYLGDLPGLGVISVSLTLCALAYAPVAVLQAPSSLPSGRVLGSILTLAVVCTAVAFILFFALIADVGPVRATVITYVNPAVAAILGVTILDEQFTLAMGIGFVFVLAGSVLATRRTPAAAVVVAEP